MMLRGASCKEIKKFDNQRHCQNHKATRPGEKAAETRCFWHLVTLTAEKSLHEGSLHDRAVHNVTKYCSRMYQNMENFKSKELVKAGRKLPEPRPGSGGSWQPS